MCDCSSIGLIESPALGVEATTTSIITIRTVVVFGVAINKMLLRNFVQRSVLDSISRLNCSNSIEGPAGTAFTLFANRINDSTVSPINVLNVFWEWCKERVFSFPLSFTIKWICAVANWVFAATFRYFEASTILVDNPTVLAHLAVTVYISAFCAVIRARLTFVVLV